MIRTANLTGPVSRAAGGLYESVRRLVQELEKNRLEVSVLGTFDQFTEGDIAAWDPVLVRAFKALGPQQFGYSPEYDKFLKLYKPELLHTHGIWIYSSMATLNYSKRSGTPYMISPHGMLDPWAVRNSRWKKIPAYWLYERAHLHRASVLRALCESEAESFRKFGLKNPLAIIPNGIDLIDLSEASVEGRGTRASVENGGRKTLLFLGRIHPKKGLPNLIRAFKKALDSRPSTLDFPWQLVIAGWDQGGHEAELIQLCEELGLKSAVTDSEQRPGQLKLKVEGERRALDARHSSLDSAVLFFGPAFGKDKEDLLRNADAFILPSFSEGLPMSVLEGWSYGLPVVMTPECNLPEGFVVDAAIRIETSAESIAEGLGTLFSMNDADLISMGQRGRELVKERFTWQTVAAQMSEVYDWMLRGGSAPECVVKG